MNQNNSDRVSMEKRLLTIAEVSHYTGFSINTLYSWAARRRIPFIKAGRLIKFDKNEIDRWIDEHKIEEKNFDL